MNTKALFLTLFSFACLFTAAVPQVEAGQSVVVKIMGVPAGEKEKIDATYPISDDGMINLPYIGIMEAAGLESKELAEKIQKSYRSAKIFDKAVIQVSHGQICGSCLPLIYLGGQVIKPGAQTFAKGLTVFQAIEAAGGATASGDLEQVVLWRAGTQQILDFTKAQGKAFLLKPNDTIEIRKTPVFAE